MGLEVYFDQSGVSNQIKIDPSANIVKLVDAPKVRYNTQNVTGSKAGPVKAGDQIGPSVELNPGYYRVDWICGLAGRAASPKTNVANNIKLTFATDGLIWTAAFNASDTGIDLVKQPPIWFTVKNKGPLVPFVVADDDTRDWYYVSSLNVTREA